MTTRYLDKNREAVHEAALEQWRVGELTNDQLHAVAETCVVPEIDGWIVEPCLDHTDQIISIAGGLIAEAPPNMRWAAIVAVRLVPRGE